jgi:hypothetical protein
VYIPYIKTAGSKNAVTVNPLVKLRFVFWVISIDTGSPPDKAEPSDPFQNQPGIERTSFLVAHKASAGTPAGCLQQFN